MEEAPIRRLIERVCSGEDRTIADLSIVLADHATVRDLNRRYLSHDYETDVLSFPLGEDEGSGVDGELYIDLDTAQERHAEFDGSFEDEVARYVVHGLLHLMGYSDASPTERQLMRAREDRYLEEWRNT